MAEVGLSSKPAPRRIAENLLQAVLDVSPDALLLLDERATIKLANDRAGRLLGRRAPDLLERSALEFLDGEPAAVVRFLRRAGATGSPLPGRLTLRTPEGPLVVYAYAAAVRADGERLIVLRCVERHPVSRVFRALEERLTRLRLELHRERRLQSELQQALQDRDTLLSEVHHRVRNTLQVMTSFLNLQMSKHAAGPARDALRDAQARIQALALVHNHLYRESNLDEIDLARLLPSLAQNVIKLYGAVDRVALASVLGPWSLPVARASPLALLVTEAVTNALKHAFPAGRSGTITLEAAKVDDRLVLRIADDGVGMPADQRARDRRTIGLDVMHALAAQLGARLEIAGAHGVEIRLIFDPPAADPVGNPAADDAGGDHAADGNPAGDPAGGARSG